MRFLRPFTPQTYALLRIVSGFLFFVHGTQKVFGVPASEWPKPALATMAGASGLIELIGGAMIMIGLFTSIAAFISSGEMAVAYFTAHQPHGALPITNKGELAALYAFVFLYIAAAGSGIWSVDRAMKRDSL